MQVLSEVASWCVALSRWWRRRREGSSHFTDDGTRKAPARPLPVVDAKCAIRSLAVRRFCARKWWAIWEVVGYMGVLCSREPPPICALLDGRCGIACHIILESRSTSNRRLRDQGRYISSNMSQCCQEIQ